MILKLVLEDMKTVSIFGQLTDSEWAKSLISSSVMKSGNIRVAKSMLSSLRFVYFKRWSLASLGVTLSMNLGRKMSSEDLTKDVVVALNLLSTRPMTIRSRTGRFDKILMYISRGNESKDLFSEGVIFTEVV